MGNVRFLKKAELSYISVTAQLLNFKLYFTMAEYKPWLVFVQFYLENGNEMSCSMTRLKLFKKAEYEPWPLFVCSFTWKWNELQRDIWNF